MPDYKITLGMSCNGYGWTETWYKNYTSTDLPALMTLQQNNLLPKRMAMLAPEASVEFISISDESVNGDAKTRYFNGVGTCPGHCDEPHATILVRCIPGGGFAAKSVFIRGQPDDCIMFGGKFQPAPPAAPPTQGVAEFVAAATTYFNYLQTNSYGWMRDNHTAEGQVITYAQDPVTGFVEYTFNAGFMPAFVGGLKPKFWKIRTSWKGQKLKAAGVHVLQQTSDTSAESTKPMAVFAAPTKPGTAIRYTRTLTTFVLGEWDLQKSGERRAGKALRRTPGRQRANPLG
jgi:hypothetical protein